MFYKWNLTKKKKNEYTYLYSTAEISISIEHNIHKRSLEVESFTVMCLCVKLQSAFDHQHKGTLYCIFYWLFL